MKEFKIIRNKAAKRNEIIPEGREFGKRLKEILKDRHMTQKRLCEITHFSDTMMCRWINGYAIMRLNTFAVLTDALGLTAMEIAYLLEAFWEDEDG